LAAAREERRQRGRYRGGGSSSLAYRTVYWRKLKPADQYLTQPPLPCSAGIAESDIRAVVRSLVGEGIFEEGGQGKRLKRVG